MRKNPPLENRETIWEYKQRQKNEAKAVLIRAKEMEANKVKK